MRKKPNNTVPDPTPQEIQAACLQINQDWPEEKRIERACSCTPDRARELMQWTPPRALLNDLIIKQDADTDEGSGANYDARED